MRVLRYKGFEVRVDYDEDDVVFFGSITGIGNGVPIHAETVGKLEIAFHKAVDEHLAAAGTRSIAD